MPSEEMSQWNGKVLEPDSGKDQIEHGETLQFAASRA